MASPEEAWLGINSCCDSGRCGVTRVVASSGIDLGIGWTVAQVRLESAFSEAGSRTGKRRKAAVSLVAVARFNGDSRDGLRRTGSSPWSAHWAGSTCRCGSVMDDAGGLVAMKRGVPPWDGQSHRLVLKRSDWGSREDIGPIDALRLVAGA